MQNSANTKPLNLELWTELIWLMFASWFEKCFQVIENIQKFMCKGNKAKLQPKIISSDNPSQNIWQKLKKYNKIGEDFKSVISNFVSFDSYCQRLVFERRNGH